MEHTNRQLGNAEVEYDGRESIILTMLIDVFLILGVFQSIFRGTWGTEKDREISTRSRLAHCLWKKQPFYLRVTTSNRILRVAGLNAERMRRAKMKNLLLK
ncbi:unnamed protein product, partial [Nesidiocoris tenuis]